MALSFTGQPSVNFTPDNPVNIGVPQYNSPAGPARPAPSFTLSGTQSSTPAFQSSSGGSGIDFASMFGVPTANAQTNSPGPGSSSAAAAQQEADMEKYFPVSSGINSLHSTLPGSQTGTTGFQVHTPTTIPSNYTNGNITMNDVLGYNQQNHNAMVNGSNPSLYPTTNNFQQMTAAQKYYTQDLPGANQFTPDQQNTYQNYINAQQNLNARAFQTKKQIADLYSSGNMTKDQADQAAQDIQRENDLQMAALTLTGQGAQLDYNTMQMARQNNIAALQAESPYYQPTQVAPGNSLVTPGTGDVMYQGSGTDPRNMFSSALQLWQSNPTYNSDGTPNYQPAFDQAQSYYSTHQTLGGMSGSSGNMNNVGGTSGNQNGGSSQYQFIGQQNQDGTYTMPDGGSINSTYAQKIANNFSTPLQQYVSTGPQGTAYINSDKVSKLPPAMQTQIANAAAKSGIPTLDGTGAAGLQSVYSLYNNLDAMTSLVDQTLSSGTAGHIKDWFSAKINDIFQNNPQLQNFNNLRTLAGQADTNLMGGIGSGFRQNTANLGVSIQNLPVATDSYENAMVKIAATRKLLDSAMSKTFPGFQGSGSITSTGSQGGKSSSGAVSVGGSNFTQNAQGQWVVSQ